MAWACALPTPPPPDAARGGCPYWSHQDCRKRSRRGDRVRRSRLAGSVRRPARLPPEVSSGMNIFVAPALVGSATSVFRGPRRASRRAKALGLSQSRFFDVGISWPPRPPALWPLLSIGAPCPPEDFFLIFCCFHR